MNDHHFFADVDLPFHVWIREGNKWVLRKAPQSAEAGTPEVPASLAAQQQNAPAEARRAA